jgi:hypothetical protein
MGKEAKMLLKTVGRDEIGRRVDEIDAEIIAETQRLRALNEAEVEIALPELAAMCERQIERDSYLVEVGVMPRELLDEAISRHRRVLRMIAERTC